MVVEPVHFARNQLIRHEARLGQDAGDGCLLGRFEWERRGFVSSAPVSEAARLQVQSGFFAGQIDAEQQVFGERVRWRRANRRPTWYRVEYAERSTRTPGETTWMAW